MLLGCAGDDDAAPDVAVPDDAAAPAIELAKQQVTVSGVSSGGYMAVQAHVALADRIGGAAVIAAGPYHCAEGSVATALGPCMSGDGLDTPKLVEQVRAAAASGAIADGSELADSAVWILHSPEDTVVASGVSRGLAEFYTAFVPADRIAFIEDVDAAHGWPTIDAGAPCLEMGGDFVNACGYDAAGEMLTHLYGELSARSSTPPAPDTAGLGAYFGAGSGVADSGFVFVPDACRSSADGCRLHIAFHGCRQGEEFVEDRFARQAGLNEWAATNRIVVVYPQIESSMFNPQGCWDWWGYTDSDYDRREGRQVRGVLAIIDAFERETLY